MIGITALPGRTCRSLRRAAGFRGGGGGRHPGHQGLREAPRPTPSSASPAPQAALELILTTMESTGADFAEVLAEAQAKAMPKQIPPSTSTEWAAPSLPSGGDRLRRAGRLPAVGTSGIREVRAADIAQARALGFVIRLVGVADCSDGHLLQRVRPCLVPTSHPLAHVAGATNAVVAEGNFAGRLLFQGAGAGAGPTASAIVADLIDIARGTAGAPFSLPVSALQPMAARRSRPPRGPRLSALHTRSRPVPAFWPRSPPRCAKPGVHREPDPARPRW